MFRGPLLRTLATVSGSAAAGGCSGNTSALDPAGPAAHSIAALWWAMLWGSAALFVLVMGLFTMVMLKPGFGARVSPRGWIVAGGLAMPVPILAILLHYALFQGERLLPSRGADPVPIRIEARAKQWQWSFRRLDAPGPTTVGTLHIPAEVPIDVVAVSDDVIHSFWVPRLGGKVDATPGHTTTVRLQADRPGRFGGVCAEYCGSGHSAMRFTVLAHSPEDYDRLATAGGTR